MIRQAYEPDVAIDTLIEHPDNPRRGDEAAIDASMEAHGFYGAVIAQASTRQIIAGNHRSRVAARRGDTTIPVLWLDVDDDEARRLMLVDNRSNDQASYETDSLVGLLRDLETTERGLVGTGYNLSDLAILSSLADNEPSAGNGDGDGRPMLGDVAYRIVVDCTDEDHQAMLIEEFTEQGLSVRAVMN